MLILEIGEAVVGKNSWLLLLIFGLVSSGITFGIRNGIVPEDSVHGPEERILLTAANIPEIIQVESPDHGSSIAIGFDKLRLAPDHGNVIKTNPLVTIEGIGTNSFSVMVLDSPASILDLGADLEIHIKLQAVTLYT